MPGLGPSTRSFVTRLSRGFESALEPAFSPVFTPAFLKEISSVSASVTTSIVMAVFLLVVSVVFMFLLRAWTDHSFDDAAMTTRHLKRVESAIDLKSTTQTNAGVCDDYTVPVENTGEVLIDSASNMDLVVEYIDAGGGDVADRLSHSTEWSVASISPDTRDPSIWNSGETATINFTLSPTAQNGTSGVVLIVSPLGISDSEYFTCVIS